MKCNACWREIEGRGIATTCGHIFCTDDAGKILNAESTCPLCEQILSKSLMKAVDLSPSDEWISMAMAGVPPHLIMKSAFKGIAFWIGQKDVEAQLTMKKAMQLRQRCEQMQAKFSEKLEQLHGAYQKAVKRVHALEQELESVSKDKAELQEKYAEKSRQKRKLEEMYDNTRNELDSVKRSAVQPSRKDPFHVQRAVKDMFSEPASGFEDPTTRRSPGDSSLIAPVTPGQTDFWPPAARPSRNMSDLQNLFDVSAIQPAQIKPRAGLPTNLLTRPGSTSPFKDSSIKPSNKLFTPGGNNPSDALRNLLLSPMKRPTSRMRTEFTS